MITLELRLVNSSFEKVMHGGRYNVNIAKPLRVDKVTVMRADPQDNQDIINFWGLPEPATVSLKDTKKEIARFCQSHESRTGFHKFGAFRVSYQGAYRIIHERCINGNCGYHRQRREKYKK